MRAACAGGEYGRSKPSAVVVTGSGSECRDVGGIPQQIDVANLESLHRQMRPLAQIGQQLGSGVRTQQIEPVVVDQSRFLAAGERRGLETATVPTIDGVGDQQLGQRDAAIGERVQQARSR